MARKLSETVKLNLRFSEELRRKLEKAAERHNQSMNLEIIERLDDSFRRVEVQEIIDIAVEAAIATTLKRLQMAGLIEEKPSQPVDFHEAILGKTSKGSEK
ncbi:MAG: Arc family DNA-binding protein [Hyphomicrobium sp.]|jgi:hypothetical protein